MKILTIIGARPQFIKASVVSAALKKSGINEILLHTGQHYDSNMSDIFFKELEIPAPDLNLEVGSGSHADQTAKMLIGIEQALIDVKPNWVLIYGDTNSTVAGALSAAKLNIPIAHIEAGMRSFNRRMPEEINRVISDHLSTLLFCSSHHAVNLLANEGIKQGVHHVGDVMYDAILHYNSLSQKKSKILEKFHLSAQGYFVATVHRAENTDNPQRLAEILDTLHELPYQVVFPVHPRTRGKIEKLVKKHYSSNMLLTEPLGYLDMLMLQKNAKLLLTDSGGIQKEAFWLNIPCVTLRDETEWVETVGSGQNIITGADKLKINIAVNQLLGFNNTDSKIKQVDCYGNGQASPLIATLLLQQNLNDLSSK